VFLKAAINGGRTIAEHPRVPVTPDAIARDTWAASAAGAAVVHLHLRDDDGGQSIHPAELDRVLEAVRAVAPETSVGTTTGLWTVTGGHRERYECIRSWRLLPDFASVAYSEEGAEETARLIVERGIVLESAVWSMDDVPALLSSAVLDRNVRVLIEPQDEDAGDAVAACRAMAAALRAGGVRSPLLYHGEDATAWPVLRAAAEDGVQMRIGFEDGIDLPDGSVARDNVQLIEAALAEYRAVRERTAELG